MISIAAQSFIEEIISGTAESIISKKNNNKFLEWKELNELLKVIIIYLLGKGNTF